MKVLTVDDSRMIRTLVRKYLAPFSLEIVEAADGQQGLDMVRESKPDLVILDVNMPVMDGPQMLRELRADPSTKTVKVLMLTAESGEKLVLELIKMGISDYIVKPFEEEVLVRKVGKILQIEPGKQGSSDTGPLKVLVLDDNDSILMIARKFLTGMAEVLTTSRPEKAVQLAVQHAPKVVLLDLQTEAVSALAAMRKESVLAQSRFVLLATKSAGEQVEAAQKAGFADVLFKPFDKEALTKAITG